MKTLQIQQPSCTVKLLDSPTSSKWGRFHLQITLDFFQIDMAACILSFPNCWTVVITWAISAEADHLVWLRLVILIVIQLSPTNHQLVRCGHRCNVIHREEKIQYNIDSKPTQLKTSNLERISSDNACSGEYMMNIYPIHANSIGGLSTLVSDFFPSILSSNNTSSAKYDIELERSLQIW